MVESKEWDWETAEKEEWLEPCEESYYYAHIWLKQGRKSLLDLGCGLGRHSMLFAKSGFKVTSVDLSDYGIKVLREWQKRENIDFLTKVCDMKSLPFNDNAFDCIWAYHVVSHTDSEGIKQIISEMERVLKPDGTVFFDLCSKEMWTYKESGFPKSDDNTVIAQGGVEDGIPHYFVDMDNIKPLLAHFTIVSIRYIDECYVKGVTNHSKHYFIEATVNKTAIPLDYSDIIGKTVSGKIDRPLGMSHPRIKSMIYNVNYGYVDGIFAPDGAEQDIYLLGVDKPVTEYSGKVIAVYHRYNDIEDKWIVAPDGMNFTDEEIFKSIDFQEKFFDGELFR